MQGRKEYTAQLFYDISLDRLVPFDNYYRIIQRELSFNFLYQETSKYYEKEGRPCSIF